MSKYHVGMPTKLIVYKNDVVVQHFGGTLEKTNNGGQKKKITKWSAKSRKKLAFVASNMAVSMDVMITLTYPSVFPADGRESKRHLDRFLMWLRRKIKPLSHLWFLEFQKRGAPHYHILYKSNGVIIEKELVSLQWYKIVGSGDYDHMLAGTRIERVRRIDGAARYAVKYAQKMYQKNVPEGFDNVGRFWGCSRDVVPKPLASKSLRGTAELRREVEGWERWSDEAPKWSVLYGAAKHVLLKDEDIL